MPGDWLQFPTGSLLLALEMLPCEAPRIQGDLDRLAEQDTTLRFAADEERGVWALQEVLEERGFG